MEEMKNTRLKGETTNSQKQKMEERINTELNVKRIMIQRNFDAMNKTWRRLKCR